MKKQKLFAVGDWDKHFVRMNLIFWTKVLRQKHANPHNAKNIQKILHCLKSFPALNCKINHELSATYRVKNNPYTGLIEHDLITKIYRDERHDIHLVFIQKWITNGTVAPNDKYSEEFHTSTAPKKVLEVTDGYVGYDNWIHVIDEILWSANCTNYEILTSRF